ncbi:CHAT domain-containing protein [Intrasporangium oryzae]|uniref:CHAT domain-containing protein n=1 Tax=Intrasporangium oryzae TaxID=412687 RepID=UPI0012FB5898|nr:CHAT domain-containing protein [Intrasporangium oryzae]
MANSAGRPAEAVRLLGEALGALDAIAGGVPEHEWLVLRCNTLITLALSDFLVAGLKPARARLRAAEEVARQAGDPGLTPRIAYQSANIHGRGGDLATAWNELQRALSHLDAFAPREQCSVHLSRGMLALELARPHEALSSFAVAASLAHEQGFGAEERMARHNEGYATYLVGDLPRALALIAEADELVEDVSLGTEALDRARVLLEAGLVSEAVEVLGGARARVGDDERAMRAEFDLELARAHRLEGRLDLATASAEAAREGYARLDAMAWETKARVLGLLIDLERWRRERARATDLVEASADLPRAAAATADELVAAAEKVGDSELAHAARLTAADALLAVGDVEAARQRLAGSDGHRPASVSDELATAAVTAEVHAAAGEATAARRALSVAARRLAAGLHGSASLDLRTARAVHGVRLASLDIELALPRGSSAVLEALERWRSATDRLPSLERPADEQLAALTEQLRAVHAQLRADPDPDQLARLRRRAGTLEREIRARDWALSSRSGGTAALDLRVREGREALARADRDLLWFFTHGGRLWGVGIVGGRARLRDLMPVSAAADLAQRMRLDLRAATTRQLGPLTAAVWGSLRASAQQLDDALVRPWGVRRGGLVLVTCEEVSALPWALLPSLSGAPVTLARSLTSFARRVGPGATHDGQPPAVHVSVGPAVPRAEAEAAAVAAAWRGRGATVELASPSSASGLVAALARDHVVHVGAHGTHQTQSPLFSSLALHDGPAFAHELQSSGVSAAHVVLSACDVGSAVSRPGEEQLGMAAAVHSLGARSVVAAVSPVPDDVAAAAMTRHHEGLARGVTSDEALAAAIAATDPVAAAFVHLGGLFTDAR